MNSVPSAASASPRGCLREAAVAGPPSPSVSGSPPPANVETLPSGSRLRMRALPVSEMNSVPSSATATSRGAVSVPSSATICTLPSLSTFSTRSLAVSAT
jgi:hypothetical protein